MQEISKKLKYLIAFSIMAPDEYLKIKYHKVETYARINKQRISFQNKTNKKLLATNLFAKSSENLGVM